MRKDLSKKLGKKNIISFEKTEDIEFLNNINNTALFAYTSDTKKRPMNLALGSMFNRKILDMFEFEVTNFIPIEYFAEKIAIDSDVKPVIIFQGDIFETDFQYDRLRKYFLDFFRLRDIEDVNITDLRRVMIISAGEDKEIKIRAYQLDTFNEYTYKESMNLVEIGPSMNLKVRRIQLGSEDFYKLSLRQPREITKKKQKNIETNALGDRRARVHMSKQNLNNMALKNYKKILSRKRFNKKDDQEPDAKIEKKPVQKKGMRGDSKKKGPSGRGGPKKNKTDRQALNEEFTK